MEFSIHNTMAGEINTLLADDPSPRHEQHVYNFAFFVESAIQRYFPILFEEYMRKSVEQFKEKLPVEFETLLNGEKIHHSEITGAIADILQQAIDKMGQEIRIKIGI